MPEAVSDSSTLIHLASISLLGLLNEFFERSSEILLLDEEHARSIARQLGVRITGAVGILLRAKLAGLIPLLRPELDQLRGAGHCYLSQAIYESVLRQAGE
jgi:predicted nucleic acid-binding protein